jgi:hypothetical protein
VRDSICHFTSAKTIKERYILTKDSLKIFRADAPTNALTTYDPAEVGDINGEENAKTNIK